MYRKWPVATCKFFWTLHTDLSTVVDELGVGLGPRAPVVEGFPNDFSRRVVGCPFHLGCPHLSVLVCVFMMVCFNWKR